MSALVQALLVRFEALEDELNALDARTGDGDHGSAMVRGLHAAASDAEDPVKAFRRAAGGASGSLFAQVLGALIEVEAGGAPGEVLGRARHRIEQIGQSKPGDKTMLDALAPAAECSSLAEAAAAAREGAESTRRMSARRGRARYAEAGGAGHIDAGARSVAELLAATQAFLAEGGQ